MTEDVAKPSKRARARKEGSIIKLGERRWQATISLGIIKGRRVRRKRICKSLREAQAALKELQQQYLQGPVGVAPQRRTIAQLSDDWMKQHVRPNLRAATWRTYEVSMRLHIVPSIGHLEVRAVTAELLRTWLAQLHSRGVGGRARQLAFTLVSRLLREAVRWRLITFNPAESVSPPRHERADMVVWTEEQSARFLRAMDGHPLHALVLLALTTGMRQGELLGLAWDDVDLDAGAIEVRRQLVRDHHVGADGKPTTILKDGPLKTKRSRRRITLPALAVSALKDHRDRMAGMGARVFQRPEGGILPPATLDRWWRAMLDQADVPRIHFHAMRHVQASLLLAAGVNVKVIQERLGHADVSVTLRVYSHLLGHEQREAATAIDTALTERLREPIGNRHDSPPSPDPNKRAVLRTRKSSKRREGGPPPTTAR